MINKITISIIVLILFCTIYQINAQNESYKTERLDIYLKALALDGDTEKLSIVLNKSINTTVDVKQLFIFAKIAEDANLSNPAEKAYQQILFVNPNSTIAMDRLGKVYYYAGKYSKAQHYLSRYNELTGGNYLSNYQLGQILIDIEQYDKAEKLFTKSLKQLNALKKQDINSQIVKANILYELNRFTESEKLFSSLIKKHPKNDSLRLDFIAMLIISGSYNKAETLLSVFPKLTKKSKNRRLFYKMNIPEKNQLSIPLKVSIYRVTIYIQKNELRNAFELLKIMKANYPNSYEVVVSEADAYSAQGNWREEKSLLSQAITMHPNDKALLERQKNLKLQYAPKFSIDNLEKFTYGQGSGNATEIITKESIDYRINDLWSLGAVTEQDYVISNNISFLNGNTGSFNGLKQKTEFFTQFDFKGNEYLNGSMLKLSYYIADNYNFLENSGLGLQFNYLDNYGKTEFEIAYRKPYWELPVAVVNGANRSRIMIGRELNIIPDLSMSGNFAFNNYSAQGKNNLDNSIEYHLNLSYILPSFDFQRKYLGYTSQIAVNYFLDSEIFLSSKKGTDANGNSYTILPLDDRLVNTFALSYYNEFTSSFKANLLVGYAFDVLDQMSHGPVASMEFSYRITDYLEANFNASHYIGITTSTYVGGGLKLYYIELFNKIWSN